MTNYIALETFDQFKTMGKCWQTPHIIPETEETVQCEDYK